MARRRKVEAKASPKPQPVASAVRKSTRQRAKKQLEEQKVNGDVSTNVGNSEDCKDPNEDSQEPVKKVNAVPKKSGRHKNLVEKTKPTTESGNSQSQEGESDNSQDDQGAEQIPIEKLDTVEVEEQVTATENTLDQVVWSEDVIEETIICEEMEVETEMTDGCSIAQDGSVVVEQVILMNDDPNFEEKDVVEYTVIQNEDGTESMIVSSENMENVETLNESYRTLNNCQMIEQGLSVLHVSEAVAEVAEPEVESKSEVVTENDKSIQPLCDSDTSETVKMDENEPKKEYRSLRSVTRGVKSTRTRKSAATADETVKNESDGRRRKTDSKKAASTEAKSSSVGGKEKSIKSRRANVQVSTSVIEQNNTQNSTDLLQKSVTLSQEDDNSSSMSDKIEHQETSDVSTSDYLKDNKNVNNSIISEQASISPPPDLKIEIANRLPAKSKNVLFGNEEHSRDSEMDGKIDSEDTKISSSSENSNDTLLSSHSCKNSDSNMDNKSALNQANDTAEKKPGFRSRSGSTDTTGSESGSNSSGVRRSNRIRTIGLMKQRSRGRGLVTKPSVDPTKTAIQQDRDKLASNTPPILDKDNNQGKDVLETILETQSDKENSSNKTTTAQDVLTPLISATGTTGYDSDSNKPVKVKSRWRRSSELEMSNSGWSASRPALGFPNPTVTGTPIGTVSNTLSDTINKLPPLPVGLPQESKTTTDIQDSVSVVPSQNSLDICSSSDSSIVANSSSTSAAVSTLIPKAVGARISLPNVPVVADREMEERLSQFEHLKENLYLTERFTSKETKRMVCECFLTEEEFQRGELGCGEDCLNRLLMIECGSRCVVGDRCTNKRFQNCEYANCEVFRTEKKGFGLRATTNLEAGDFIMEYVGEVLDPKDFRKRAKEYSKDKNRHYYFMALKSDQIIDATMKGNISRFINHSCDPNAETQKWTVNGELRIGFFNKKFVAAGEEITFDYHFQRYGKEAQKCFCEATNCRGWIGDKPEDNKKSSLAEEMEDTSSSSESDVEDAEDNKEEEEDVDKPETPVKPVRRRRRKRVEKKVTEHMEDEDLEEQIDKLCASGLKNRAHTLTLSRLMVRSREIQHRTRLLKVIRFGEQACRRLFLDYHGLRLMWGYMMDVAGSSTDEVQQFRLEILKTLSTLPIPNRSMLIDSKVLSVIEKWSKQLYQSSGESPEDDQSKPKSSNEETEMDTSKKPNAESETNVVKKESELEIKCEGNAQVLDPTLISELANNLLVSWSNLKEVFRIPKKERIEQMKEHEREADRGYKEDVEKEARESSSYERHRSDRYSRNELEKRPDRRRGRDSPDFEHSRAKDKRTLEERPNLVQVPRLSKFERRQLFAMKVAKEEEERQRRQQEESWQQHQAQCIALGLDPYATPAFDPQTGYHLFFNPQLSQWQPYPSIQEGAAEIAQQVTPVYMGPGGSVVASPAGAIVGTPQPPLYPIGQPPPPYGTPLIQLGPGNLIPMPNGTAPLYVEKLPEPESEQQIPVVLAEPEPEVEATPVPPPPLDLPPKWKWARDKRGRVYYYHVKERVSQWLPPPPDHIAVQPDSSTTSESSDESSSSNEEEDDVEEQLDQTAEGMEVDASEVAVAIPQPEGKKRRDGLVQERIISPRREEDRVDHKKYKEIKEKLRRQKERAKLKEHFEKMKKHRRSSKSKSHAKHASSKFQPITSDMSPTTERRIKDTFRINMANVMVHFLNPYRKSDCKQGRITNTDDFKHLARKLTHFVLAKELKHCKSVDELECNDNVKHKAKDFVRKYMSKFGAVYQKGTDED
ncbi:histone-lysine N-methyltransferase SETD2 isoform X1 [Nasonia vitripennis]|uniref:[histone H3]-lysine(36) N-trimethyltransferase n=1 Tax=Nasonia vitripennis TaxID=7425 RepID=A0A7M7QP78_NASVI|nr:histone-lysine N-methyltransferase SETD2 isoform X1 [Nasonia vitripennis]XP_032452465.1 histone-lysine N-methyltransferase SETD2 isoform X1 [Nasonia vitripennis]XP_032452466.1 histone-lysine N-methyltransferase SETD2 isoform X1 [Nasonia vitripennis]XP_032452467.1 histone-lysine N-methyltransferase SETD2 isoform X1 [Nasonia vitripennis]